jgi:predicted Zn-ribbon and HTH transcriptional regulator
MVMKCKHCHYEWNYEGISVTACCPKCRKYTSVPDIRAHLEAQAAKQAADFKKKEEGIQQ